MMFGCGPEEFAKKMQELFPEADPENSYMPVMGPKYERRPSGLYESMLKQIAPYRIRGFLYYQGETDGDTHPECYRTMLPALIRNWRHLWQEELPFLFVQIAPLERWMDCIGAAYVRIREAQQHTADTVPGAWMAVTSDVGMQHDINPKKKQPVGHRLALLAEANVYGKEILCEAPTLTAAEVREGRVILRFDHAGEGLYLADRMPDGSPVNSRRLGGLELIQEGQTLEENQITAKADGSEVILQSQEIRGDFPVTVKLAKTGWYQINLYNSADIPARPAQVNSDL